MYKFKFADIGEGLHEGVVAEIYKNVGDKVSEGDSLFSVETDKVTSDIPSPTEGVIKEVLMKVGDTIHVGDEIYHIDNGSGESAPAEEDKNPQKSSEEAASVVGDIKVSNEIIDLSSMKSSSKAQKGDIRKGKVGSSVRLQDGKLITPFARSLAAEKGIDLSNVQGSGSNGRILVKDIENFKGAPSPQTNQVNSAAAPVKSSSEDVRVKVAPIRKAIASAMKTSWSTVAYTNLVNEVNMTKLWDERKLMVESVLAKTGVKITFTAFAAKATAIALKEFPNLNAKYDEATNEIIQFGSVHLGLAVDTPKGLMVPVIKNADSKSVVEIAKDIIDLAVKARDGKLTMPEMQGGTFTLTNYGSAGAFFGVPVINVGEMGIIGTGAIVDRVYSDKNGNFYNGKVMNLTTAADHRWVDGADIGRFNMRVKELLENPAMMGVL
ncbi:MAG: 2-oxo acid dehydrogenase subunit E2 [Mycoplasmatales bacterium]|nr:2-oxo acid dehydrogenase subunit E2 [Mycoplasmatales bacterium]